MFFRLVDRSQRSAAGISWSKRPSLALSPRTSSSRLFSVSLIGNESKSSMHREEEDLPGFSEVELPPDDGTDDGSAPFVNDKPASFGADPIRNEQEEKDALTFEKLKVIPPDPSSFPRMKNGRRLMFDESLLEKDWTKGSLYLLWESLTVFRTSTSSNDVGLTQALPYLSRMTPFLLA